MRAVACVLLLLVVVSLPVGAQQGITGKVLLRTTTTEAGQPLQFPLFRNQVKVVRIEVAPGGTTEATRIEVPAVGYVIEGSASMERSGQPPRTISADQAVALPLSSPLALVNRGNVPVTFLIVFFGEAGKPSHAFQPGVTPGVRLTVMLDTTKTVAGETLLFPPFANQFEVRIGELAPGAINPRHNHSHTVLAYVLDGALTLKPDGLPPKTLRPGDAGVEPLISHVGSNAATTPTRALVIYVGEAGTPPTTYLP